MAKNLISRDLLNKRGFRQVLESDVFVLSKKRMLVGQGYSCNGMIKLNLMKNSTSAYMIESDCLWHARLGHVNYRAITRMNKLEIINYVPNPHDHEKCQICVQAKITRQSHKSVERSTEMLNLIHSDVCEMCEELSI